MTLARSVAMEMDFRLEAAALSEMAENTRDDPDFRVPTVDWERTARHVLTLEWIDGTPFEGNRYVDRFVVRGGQIVKMDVWNDSAERLLIKNGIELSDPANSESGNSWFGLGPPLVIAVFFLLLLLGLSLADYSTRLL